MVADASNFGGTQRIGRFELFDGRRRGDDNGGGGGGGWFVLRLRGSEEQEEVKRSEVESVVRWRVCNLALMGQVEQKGRK